MKLDHEGIPLVAQPRLGLCTSMAEGTGWGTKILQAVWCGQKNKDTYHETLCE